MKLNTSLQGNMLAGVIAFAIYLVISVATGERFVKALVGVVVLGLGTFVISFLITRAIIASRS